MNKTTLAPRHLPIGGLRVSRRLLRRWRWRGVRAGISEPVRCKRDAWYLVRAVFDPDADVPAGPFGWRIVLRFGEDKRFHTCRCVELAPWTCDGRIRLGWVRSPEDATHLALELPGDGPWPTGLTLHPVAEPDIRSHPLANVPPWSNYEATPTMRRIVLPASLAGLEWVLRDGFDGEVRTIDTPRSTRALAREVVGSAWVFDPSWAELVSWRELRTLAEASRVVVDLGTFARLAGLRPIERGSDYDLFSARVEYAGFATRGFALQDVFAWCTFDGVRFSQRAIRRDAAWRRLAQREGLCTLLTNETPWENRNGDILAAMRDAGTGQLVVTDAASMVQHAPPDCGELWGTAAPGCPHVRTSEDGEVGTVHGPPFTRTRSVGPPCPTRSGSARPVEGDWPPSDRPVEGNWPPSDRPVEGDWPPSASRGQSRATGPHLAGQSGATGPHLPIAPRLAAHLLRMMLGLRIDPAARYQVREPDEAVVVRDIAELARRYPPLRAVRWRSRTRGVVEPGLWLPARSSPPRRQIVLHTGRLDRDGRQPGWPPEPLMILMRRLASDAGVRDTILRDCDVFWQFSSACGTRYATLFEAAPRLDPRAVEWIDLTQPDVLRELPPVGCAGDGSIEQMAAIERAVLRRVKNAE